MNRLESLKELEKQFYKYDCNIYDFCYYLGIKNVKENISDKDLLILLDKCSELSGEYTDPIEVGQSLAHEIYEEKSIKINELKRLNIDKFNEWFDSGREIGNKIDMEEEYEK